MKQEAARKKYLEKLTKKSVKGTPYEKIIAGKDGKYKDGKPLVIVNSYWGAFKELFMAEVMDKTFITLLIFTIAWTNPATWGRAYPKPAWRVYSDGTKVINYRRTHVGPGRIWCAATLGTIFVDVQMAYKTKEVSENGWRLTTALILILFLLNYSYALISAHLSIVTKLEADHQYDVDQKKQSREISIHDWARFEIEKSKDFNEEHQKTIVDKFMKDMAGRDQNDLDNDFKLFKKDTIRDANDQLEQDSDVQE